MPIVELKDKLLSCLQSTAIALSQESSILTRKKMIVKSTLGGAKNDIMVICTTHKA